MWRQLASRARRAVHQGCADPHLERTEYFVPRQCLTSPVRRFNVVPMVIESVPGGERAMDIWSLLLKKRVVFVQGEITEGSATSLIAQLLYLESVQVCLSARGSSSVCPGRRRVSVSRTVLTSGVRPNSSNSNHPRGIRRGGRGAPF